MYPPGMDAQQTCRGWPARALAAALAAAGLLLMPACGESESRLPATEEFQRRHQADLMDRLDEIAAEEAETPPQPEPAPVEPEEPEKPGGV